MNKAQLARFLYKVLKTDSCWIWIGAPKNASGYGVFYLDGKSIGAHRASYEHFVEKVPDSLWVLHRCDNPPCVRPDHLFVGSARDNTQDMVAKGRHYKGDLHWTKLHPEWISAARGEKSGTAKLTEKLVVRMRQEYAAGTVTLDDLAKSYSMSLVAVYKVIHGQTWAHVAGPISKNSIRRQHHVHKRKYIPVGELVGTSKLTWEKVREIRATYSPRIVSRNKLAKKYGVSKTTIDRILSGWLWKEGGYGESTR